jgi:CRP/FNR family transcriptional regulator
MEKLRKYIESVVLINEDEFEYIKTFFSLKRVRKCQYLLNEGDEVKHEYLVMQGVFKVFCEDEQGKEYIVQFAQENCWMSDYSAFFKHDQATMYIECLEQGEVLCLTHHGREKLSSELSKMEHFFAVERSNNYVALEQRVKLLLRNRPLQRYEAFSKLYPGLINRIPKKMIAQYLGLCRETLSRLY